MIIRKAKVKDVKKIYRLINYFAQKNLMLARSLNELYENLRDFWVAEEDKELVGCSALHISWQDLAEIKSVAVKKEKQNRGIGTKLVNTCIEEAKELGVKTIFLLTYQVSFFKRFGFKKISHKELPHKIWAECIRCPKFPNCKETAMIKEI